MTATIRAAALAVSLAAATLHSAAPPPELNVAVVGDSLAHGVGDESGMGIAGRLEPELRSRGVESIVATNLGTWGATTRDLAAKLRQPDLRASIAAADAIVLSIGANDIRLLFTGEEPLRSPLAVAGGVLRNIERIVAELRLINPGARILILGAYAPLARGRAAEFLEPLIAIWDTMLALQFAADPLVTIVPISDIVGAPERLSTLDSFHPGGEAYQEAAARIAELLAGPRLEAAAEGSPGKAGL
ncbi:MAG TPA: GDSL-type esterase/lipase family protein [Thermoanaerobaculia bacterium]|nr:GDSL-type esterase/lipase family protein [Thermoanaerobaculia bacterium]